MNAVAQLSAAIAALILIAVFPFEAFLIHRPEVQRFLARNALAGVGTLVGLWMVKFGD